MIEIISDPFWFLLPAIILIGSATTYTDLRHGKIRNRHIIYALIYMSVVYGALFIINASAGVPVKPSYFSDLALNMTIALLVAFFAWQLRIWSAADGKLFFAYSGLIPLTSYSNEYYQYFPSFVILVNTFIPVFIFLALKSLLITGADERAEFLRVFRKSDILKLLVGLFWISWVSRLLVRFVGVDIGALGNVLLIISFVFLVNKMSKWRLSIFISALSILFDYRYVFTPLFIYEYIIYTLVAMAMFFIFQFSRTLYGRNYRIRDLKPGMMIAENIIFERGIYKKMDSQEMHKNRELLEGRILRIGRGPEGVTNAEIRRLCNLERKSKLDFRYVRIMDTLPFSPFLFAGVLLTVIFQGSFVLLAKWL